MTLGIYRIRHLIYNIRHTTYDMLYTKYDIRHTTYETEFTRYRMREIAYDIWRATHRPIDTVPTRYQPVLTISSLDQLIEPALEVHDHVIATSHIRSTVVYRYNRWPRYGDWCNACLDLDMMCLVMTSRIYMLSIDRTIYIQYMPSGLPVARYIILYSR